MNLGTDPTPASNRRTDIQAVLIVAIVALLGFLPAVQNDFVNFDDHSYVLKNDHLRGGLSWSSFFWAWSSWSESNYHPVTWLSHLLDVSLFGLRAAGHHASSIVIHAINSALVVVVGRMLGLRIVAAAVCGLLFALHPLRCESVAWVSERKDVLSVAFALVSMAAWVRFRVGGQRVWWATSLLALVFGLCAKPMLVTVPCVLVLLDGLPLRRHLTSAARMVLPHVPFFLVVAGFSVVTLGAQQDAMMDLDRLPVSTRLLLLPVRIVRYVAMTLVPHPLGCLYPVETSAPWISSVLAAVFVAALLWFAFRLRHAVPVASAGVLWFLGTLVPVLGLVQVGRAAVADRYTYLPHIGLFLAAVALVEAWRLRATPWLLVLLVVWLPLTERQIGVWRDTRTLFTNAVEHWPDSAFSQDALAGELLAAGSSAEAVDHARRAVALAPAVPRYAERLARSLAVSGEMTEAEKVLRDLLSSSPTLASAWFSLSAVLHQSGRDDEALPALRRAVSEAAHEPDAQIRAKIFGVARSQGLVVEEQAKATGP